MDVSAGALPRNSGKPREGPGETNREITAREALDRSTTSVMTSEALDRERENNGEICVSANDNGESHMMNEESHMMNEESHMTNEELDRIAEEGKEAWFSRYGSSILKSVGRICGNQDAASISRASESDAASISRASERSAMGLFHADVSQQICQVNHAKGERLSITIDSGAAESIMPQGKCADYPLSAGMWTGSEYGTADGGVIRNLGERLLVMDVQNGATRGMQFQVGDKATKALGAVSRIADKGNRVVFEASHGYIQSKQNGACTYFDRKDDVYVMETIVRPFSTSFRRPS